MFRFLLLMILLLLLAIVLVDGQLNKYAISTDNVSEMLFVLAENIKSKTRELLNDEPKVYASLKKESISKPELLPNNKKVIHKVSSKEYEEVLNRLNLVVKLLSKESHGAKKNK